MASYDKIRQDHKGTLKIYDGTYSDIYPIEVRFTDESIKKGVML